MLRNLLPDFLAVLDREDRVAAYRRYFEAHRPLLAAYWDNYVVDPDGAHFDEVVRATVAADRDDREVLEADERRAAAVDDELPRVRRADADHHDDVDLDVAREQRGGAVVRFGGERQHVGAREHRAQIVAIRSDRRAHDLVEVRAVGIHDVVVPVGGEQRPVRLEVAPIGRDAVLAVEHGEEVGQQVAKHLRPEATVTSDAIGAFRAVDAHR